MLFRYNSASLTAESRASLHNIIPMYLEKDSVGKAKQEVDIPASRRVEIKFRLKEDEIIKKIAGILEQDIR